MLILSTIALLLGFLLDLLFGDPRGFPHIVIGMGKLISVLEKRLRAICSNTPQGERVGGAILVLLVLLIWEVIPFCILLFIYQNMPWLGLLLDTFLCYQILATKSLHDESMKVYRSLEAGNLKQARSDVSMIVGRDTEHLDETGVVKAAVETVAENTSDGVIAPLFYLMLGGAGFGCLYKAINTLDSMVGYQNKKYMHFGRVSAKLDDAINFIPARLAAKLMLIAAFLLRMDAKRGHEIYRRDKRNHASPNAAHTEAVCAGILNIQLAGDAYYFGKRYQKPFIGDQLRPIEPKDIERANRLMFITALLMLLLVMVVRMIVIGGVTIGAL